MMVAVFASLLLALVFAYRGRTRLAELCMVATLVFAVGLFMYEIYSPEYGFRMPWIQTRFDAPVPTGLLPAA